MSSTPAFNASLALVTTTNLNNGPDAACKKKGKRKKNFFLLPYNVLTISLLHVTERNKEICMGPQMIPKQDHNRSQDQK